MLKPIIKIGPCFFFLTEVGFEQSQLYLAGSEKISEGSELGFRLCPTACYMTPSKSLSLSGLQNVENTDLPK